ncbi:hypothetical protein K227x_07710 [Rubripirellula lacrimiformis]|uniref:Thioredoxin domain-containing protein n=1 Tax=Rubripirellula lacrimiformis TaxID=1930273 RepID=A0A517N5I8_9BACT|nr:SCO family protein [Rubripirellula lacrimiformis]QDT02395.1 hypothetical protein K227x_07710 [Rubripirellula lacrimiformis]
MASKFDSQAIAWMPGQVASRRRFVPNVPIVTHDNRRKLFYDDLVKDRTVIVQFVSLAYHPNYPVTRNLIDVQRRLGDRLGDDVFMISITSDPENDNVAALAEFSKRHHAKEGWTFVTGDVDSLSLLQQVFFFHGDETHQQHHSELQPTDCSAGLLRYGNDTAGIWGSVPTKTDAAQIIDRLAWITPNREAKRPKGIRRAGPRFDTATRSYR